MQRENIENSKGEAIHHLKRNKFILSSINLTTNFSSKNMETNMGDIFRVLRKKQTKKQQQQKYKKTLLTKNSISGLTIL